LRTFATLRSAYSAEVAYDYEGQKLRYVARGAQYLLLLPIFSAKNKGVFAKFETTAQIRQKNKKLQ
jgi:hypothetical protein